MTELIKYTEGDETSILDLFEITFKKRMSLEYWNWRFDNNIFSNEKFISLAWNKRLLIGHYAVSPLEIVYDNNLLKAGLSMTTMTHPEYGGLGIFPMLAKHTLHSLKDENYSMILGFPNNNSHYGFINGLKWKDINYIAVSTLQKIDFEKKINLNVEYLIPENIDDKIARTFFNSESVLQINKTAKYLTWRYLCHPENSYKILGIDDCFVIYKCYNSTKEKGKVEIDIMEISNNLSINILINILSVIFTTEENIFCINCWLNIHSAKYKIYEKIGFKLNSPIFYFSNKMIVDNYELSEKALNFKNWDISFGYSDIF